ncbi:MAG: acyltransferase family protein [Gemmatimonadaceae bacterium]
MAHPDDRIAHFDGLRSLAVLAVLAMHATQLPVPLLTRTPLDRMAVHAALSGWIGVDLFFVLSGYLITGILLDSRGASGYFRSFYARRTLRIFPLYYGVLAGMLLVVPMLLPALIAHPANASAGQLWDWTYLTNWRIAWMNAWDAVPTHTAHFWSLAVEEQFYLCWPLLVWWLGPRGIRRLSIALLAAAPVLRALLLWRGVSPVAVFVTTPTRMDGLAAGALLACLARDMGTLAAVRPLARRAGAIAGVALLLIAVRVRLLDQNDPLVQVAGFSALAAAFASVVALAGTQRWLGHPVLAYLGRRSYALYVFHPMVIALADRASVARGVPLVAGSGVLRQGAFFCAAAAGTVLVAEVSWRLWESPWMGLKRFAPRPLGVGP